MFRRLINATLPIGTRMAYFSPAINPNSVLKKRPNLKENLPVNPGEILYYNLMHGDPDIIVAGMEKMLEYNPAGFNLNCGCPRAKIRKSGMCPVGVALMDYPERVAAIVTAAKKSFPAVHFSIKIRAGVRHNLEVLYDFCRQAEDAGSDAIIFHARSGEDQFKRPARHALFGELKQRLSIPLIGNGDIITDEQAVAVKQKYGLNGVMIGRGALVTPGIFRAIAYRLTGKPLSQPVMSWIEKRDFFMQFVRDMDNEFGTDVMLRRTKLFARWLCIGLESGHTFEGNIYKAKTADDTLAIISNFFEKPKRQYSEVIL
ncbi:MAG: tRNA-dihydrouridine synthase family protein [Spirochaetes bacterium]|nr:tRNA-dihydrouridine synthase family protein [Spirochaetota bacterium]